MPVMARKGRIGRSAYAVHGSTLAALQAEIDDKGPPAADDGRRCSSLTSGRLTLLYGDADVVFERIRDDADGVEVDALLARGTVISDCEITLPRLAASDALSLAAAREWSRFIDAIELHTQGHVDACFAAAQRVADELNKLSARGIGVDEPSARAAALRGLFDTLRRSYAPAQLEPRVAAVTRAYDSQTRGGADRGVVLNLQFDANA